MKFGIDRLIADAALRQELAGRRVALLAHPASVTEDLTHSLDALAQCPEIRLSAAFGPQHGLRGDKQDNMVESPDFIDPKLGIPIFSLYGEVRSPTPEMMDSFDVILIDLQDLGCRIYTFITTLRYILEAAAKTGKSVWVLDRPNPAGRPVEGLTLRAGWESFVGAGAIPMRHGLTMGELGLWFIDTLKLNVDYRIVEMDGYDPNVGPGFGWPIGDRVWINRVPSWSKARPYRKGGAQHARSNFSARLTLMPALSLRKWPTWRRIGWPDAFCAIVGLNRPSTSMWAVCAMASIFMPKARLTIMRLSNPGGFRRSPSRQSACCIRIIPSGAVQILSMNIPKTSSPLM